MSVRLFVCFVYVFGDDCVFVCLFACVLVYVFEYV